MSVPYSQVPSTLLLDPDMTLSAVRVWHVVYTETLGRPGWDLSYQQIADKIGSSRRQTAMDAVALLLNKGWLIRVRQKDALGDSAPNLYVVCREPFVPWNAESVRSSAQGGAANDTTPGTPDRTHQENHLPGEQTPPSPAVTQFALMPPAAKPVSDFDAFWAIYPRQVGKKAAMAAYKRALKDTDHDTLIAAVIRQTPGWPDKRFIPHPTTWLNQGRWDDETPSGGVYQEDPLLAWTPPTTPIDYAALNAELDDEFARKKSLEGTDDDA